MPAETHLTEQDRTEATCVSTRGEGHQFEIQLGHLCNNRCVFCSSGQLTQMKIARHIPLDPMLTAIEEARASGARRITFLGGEPTLHKGFLTALKRTVELGFEEIVIFTNGVMLPHPGFIDKVVALGRFEWRISIQGATEASHVAVTGRADSFRRIVDGLEMLRARGQLVTANICVNQYSYESLPEFPELIRKHGIRQLHLDIVRPSSAGERSAEYLRDIMPRYSLMAPAMGEMLARFEREDPEFDVNIGNLPFCVMPQWSHRISHGGEETITKSSGPNELEVAVDKYAWHASMRRFTPRCDSCAFRPHCTGIFSQYLELYGDEEFQPIDPATLEVASHFVLLTEPLIKPLEQAAPAGWSLKRIMRDRRGHHIDLHFRDAADRTAILQFSRPKEPSEHLVVLDTDRFRLAVNATLEVPAPELTRLLGWAAGLLAEGPVDVAGVTEQHQRAQLMARGRGRISQLIERVEGHADFAGWRPSGHHDEGDDAVVELLGPRGDRIDVVFTIRWHGDRPSVSLDARPGAGIGAGVARSVVQRLAVAIRDA